MASLTEEEVRCEIIMNQFDKLRSINYNKYKQISRDFDDILYPTTQTGLK